MTNSFTRGLKRLLSSDFRLKKKAQKISKIKNAESVTSVVKPKVVTTKKTVSKKKVVKKTTKKKVLKKKKPLSKKKITKK